MAWKLIVMASLPLRDDVYSGLNATVLVPVLVESFCESEAVGMSFDVPINNSSRTTWSPRRSCPRTRPCRPGRVRLLHTRLCNNPARSEVRPQGFPLQRRNRAPDLPKPSSDHRLHQNPSCIRRSPGGPTQPFWLHPNRPPMLQRQTAPAHTPSSTKT